LDSIGIKKIVLTDHQWWPIKCWSLGLTTCIILCAVIL